MKNILIDWVIPFLSGFLFGRVALAIGEWALNTRTPSLWLVLPPTIAFTVYFGAFVYPSISRWLKG